MNEFDDLMDSIRRTAAERAGQRIARAERQSVFYVGPLTGPMYPSFNEAQKASFIKAEQEAAVRRVMEFLHGVAANGAP